jgi:serine/threonine-protein kinase RsbW
VELAGAPGGEMRALLRLEVPAVAAYVGLTRTIVTNLAASLPGIDDDRLDDLRIAVSEACTSAIDAHDPTDDDDLVVVRCELDDDALYVQIDDRADGADRQALTEEDDPGGERGWGLQLIRALVDDATFHFAGQRSSVRLTVKLVHEGD